MGIFTPFFGGLAMTKRQKLIAVTTGISIALILCIAVAFLVHYLSENVTQERQAETKVECFLSELEALNFDNAIKCVEPAEAQIIKKCLENFDVSDFSAAEVPMRMLVNKLKSFIEYDYSTISERTTVNRSDDTATVSIEFNSNLYDKVVVTFHLLKIQNEWYIEYFIFE